MWVHINHQGPSILCIYLKLLHGLHIAPINIKKLVVYHPTEKFKIDFSFLLDFLEHSCHWFVGCLACFNVSQSLCPPMKSRLTNWNFTRNFTWLQNLNEELIDCKIIRLLLLWKVFSNPVCIIVKLFYVWFTVFRCFLNCKNRLGLWSIIWWTSRTQWEMATDHRWDISLTSPTERCEVCPS